MIILAAKHNNRSSSLSVIQREHLIIRTQMLKETDIIQTHTTKQIKYPENSIGLQPANFYMSLKATAPFKVDEIKNR